MSKKYVLRWFHKSNGVDSGRLNDDKLVGERNLPNVTTDLVSTWRGLNDSPIFCYCVGDNLVAGKIGGEFDFDKYDYFVEIINEL